MNRENLVTNLFPGDTAKIDFSFDVVKLIENFKNSFEKSIMLDESHKYVKKYGIDNPFEGVLTPDKAAERRAKKSQKCFKSKWELVDLSVYSTKYLAALDKVVTEAEEKEEHATEEKSEECWQPIDEEWRQSIREYLQEECSVDIEWPEEIQEILLKPVDTELKKKKDSTERRQSEALKPATAKKIKGRKESIAIAGRVTHVDEQGVELGQEGSEEQEVYVPTWQELEEVRVKCSDWLTRRCHSSHLPIKTNSIES